MKYTELKEPETLLKEGDEYIRREALINSIAPQWKKERAASFGGSIGKPINQFPDYIFRRPEPEPIEVTLNRHYRAKVYSDKVIVNDCPNASFEFQAIEYLYTMVRQAKGENITPPTTQRKEQHDQTSNN